MKLTVLVDNNTFIDQYYIGEPAVSYLVEDGEARVLLDVGYSDVFIKNAKTLGIDLGGVQSIVLSHGHNDHTGGLKAFADSYQTKNVRLIAHPDVFNKRICDKLSIGSPVDEPFIADNFDLLLTKDAYQISQNLIFLGEIPSYNNFERKKPIGEVLIDKHFKDDFVLDDTAIAYKGKDGLFIITGCSHSGICNIIEHAKKICGESRITGVIGGFHIFKVSEELEKTIAYLRENKIENLYPCHCVSFNAKAEIHRHIPINEVGVGLKLEVE